MCKTKASCGSPEGAHDVDTTEQPTCQRVLIDAGLVAGALRALATQPLPYQCNYRCQGRKDIAQTVPADLVVPPGLTD